MSALQLLAAKLFGGLVVLALVFGGGWAASHNHYDKKLKLEKLNELQAQKAEYEGKLAKTQTDGEVVAALQADAADLARADASRVRKQVASLYRPSSCTTLFATDPTNGGAGAKSDPPEVRSAIGDVAAAYEAADTLAAKCAATLKQAHETWNSMRKPESPHDKLPAKTD